jgi:LPXTG-motif cell wall-anchored protein
MTDIHDILPPLPVGIDAPWMVPVLLALAAAAILAAAWWFWKKRKKARTIETIVPELPPEMTAMRALDEISDVRRLAGKTFYFRLSAILRQYVFGRFAVGAPEMTTEEFIPCIDRLNMDKALAQRLRGLCRAMDPVKFGGETVMENQMEADLLFAREFVRKTTLADEKENKGEEHMMLHPDDGNSKKQIPNVK